MPATPVPWPNAAENPTIVFTDGEAAIERGTRIAALPNGDFVVVFTTPPGDLSSSNEHSVGVFRYDASGVRTGGNAFPSQFTSQAEITSSTRLDVAARRDGGFTVVVTEDDNGTANTDSEVYNFSAAGVFQSSQLIDSTSRDENHSVEVDGYGDGYVAVSDANAGAIRFVANLGPTANVSTSLPIVANEQQLQADVAYLGDGRAVVTYTRQIANDPSTTTIAWDIVSTATGAVLQAGTVPGASDRDDVPAVVALEDGGFAIAYRDFQGGAGAIDTRLFLAIYDERGTFIVQNVIEEANSATNPRLAAQDGEIVVTWSEGGTIWLQRYTEAGTTIGSQVRVDPPTGTSASSPDISITTDGRYAVAYIERFGLDFAPVFSIFDPRDGTVISPGAQATAPALGGTVIGTQAFVAEDLTGGDGNDTILPSLGGGTLDGGDGTDTLNLSLVRLTAPIFNTATTNLTAQTLQLGLTNYVARSFENVIGTVGTDVVTGSAADNVITLGAGNDTFNASRGQDAVSGGPGIDTLGLGATAGGTFRLFDNGPQSLAFLALPGTGGTGTLEASGFENVDGSNLADTITGNLLDNRLLGRNGDDFLLGAAGDDTLIGGNDNDRLRGGGGNDIIDGGNGIDTADYFGGSSNVTVNLNVTGAQNTGQGVDTLTSIENIIAGDGNDVLTGNGGANFLVGNGGDDTLSGGGGNDTLRGGSGVNAINGGSGVDTVDFADAAGNVVVSLANTAQQNTIGGGIVTLTSVENVVGGNGNDQIVGNAGNNVLSGGFGNDTLAAGGGNDTLAGGRGLDLLTGGAGRDLFVYEQLDFRDTVRDFEDDVDTLDLRDFGFTSVAQAQGFAAQVGPDVVYTFDTGPGPTAEVLTVENITIAALADDIFV